MIQCFTKCPISLTPESSAGFFFFLMQIFDPYPSSPLGSAPVLLTVPSLWVVIDSSQSEAPDINFN